MNMRSKKDKIVSKQAKDYYEALVTDEIDLSPETGPSMAERTLDIEQSLSSLALGLKARPSLSKGQQAGGTSDDTIMTDDTPSLPLCQFAYVYEGGTTYDDLHSKSIALGLTTQHFGKETDRLMVWYNHRRLASQNDDLESTFTEMEIGKGQEQSPRLRTPGEVEDVMRGMCLMARENAKVLSACINNEDGLAWSSAVTEHVNITVAKGLRVMRKVVRMLEME